MARFARRASLLAFLGFALALGSAAPTYAADPAIATGFASARADGMMLGILLAVLVLQIAGWAITRDPSIPFYLAFVITLGLGELLRGGMLPSTHAIPPLAMFAFLNGLTGIASFGFVTVYLRLWQDARRMFWMLLAVEAPKSLVTIAFALIPALQPYAEVVRAPSFLIGILVTLPIALLRARRFPPGFSLASAFGFLMLAVIYRVLRQFTGLDSPLLDRWLYEIAAAADVLLFGIALIVRARYVVRERRGLEVRLEVATAAAEHDPLTGALNRRGLFSRAATKRASGTLFFLDVEGCDPVEAVAALRGVAPEDALVARIDGDQFVVVTREGTGRPEVLANRFADAVAAHASIGFVMLDGMPFENALRIAGANAYRAKASRRTSEV
jgi:GGDEF domain-containing protein